LRPIRHLVDAIMTAEFTQDPENGSARSPRSMRAFDRHISLHAQGDVFQLKYLAQQADALVDAIDDLVVATERVAAMRIRHRYVRTRMAGGTPVGEKARWERAI
jgi:hypothetical protein